MPDAHEQFSEQFRTWERRGRGWQVFPEPISPEPPFRPFTGHFLTETAAIDDGRRPTFLSSLVRKLGRRLSTLPEPTPVPAQPETEPEPDLLERDTLVELQTSLPAELDIHRDAFEEFFLSLSFCEEPIAFELLGVPDRITAQFVANSGDASLVQRQLRSYFPEAVFQPHANTLIDAWNSCAAEESLVIEFGLRREFMFSLRSGKLDPFIGIVGALSELQENEFGLFQVIWQPARHPWQESILNSVLGGDGKPFFVNVPELAKAAESKSALPIFAAVVRVLICAESFPRTLKLARDLAGALSVFSDPSGNELIPLNNEDYPLPEHIEDTLRRQSRRTGMILNSDELIGLVHLPGSAVQSPAFQRQGGTTRAAPATVRHDKGLFLGYNDHIGESVAVQLSPEQRVRHMHVIGASGTGKSTLLFNIIKQGIEDGEGIAVFDPHGDLVERVLGIVPEARIDDVVLVDPSDEHYAVGFNVLAAHSELEKTLLASDLVSVFQRLSTSWGDQMTSVLQNAILAFLESGVGGTIADLRRFLIEPAFRAQFLKSVQDSEVVYYWKQGFPHLTGTKSIGPILIRLDTLLAKKPIRHMVSQGENRLDFAHIMDSGKIFLAKLPEGLLGRENSHLIGSLLISKFQQTAMSRQAQHIAARRDYWIVIDEFANFITPSMAEILSGARKYRIGLTLAHQELHQLQRSSDVASAVMSHPFTRVVFRVGDDDAKKLAEGFSHFEAKDLRNLETGHALCRVERSDFDFNLRVPLPSPANDEEAASRREEVITASRNKYGRLKSEIEAQLRAKLETASSENQSSKTAHQSVRKDAEPKPVPMPAEVPKTVITELLARSAEPQPVASETKVVNPEANVARDLGRGGAQHQAIQQRIKTAAEEQGFRATIERQVLDGLGSIDLLLERSDQTIACEITITTSIDQEVGNISKCARAGFEEIAMISVAEDKLRKIESAVAASLGPDAARRVKYFLPDAFIERLRMTPPVPKPAAEPEVFESRGRRIRRSLATMPPAEQKRRDEEARRAMAEAMRTKPKP